MSKSVIVIDTPSDCLDCPMCHKAEMKLVGDFTYKQLFYCIAKDEEDYYYIPNVLKKPNWCPLSSIPDKIKVKQFTDNTALNIGGTLIYQYAQGWNDLREKLLEEK